MLNTPINFHEKLSQFQDQWSPKVIAELNDYQFKLVKVQGEFVWHEHAETDEAFIVLMGRLKIELPETTVELGAGDLFVVPRGIQHKPSADEECHVLVIEPRGVVNTGDVGGELTAPNDVWLSH
jgi:mannose-6-phosphate isomerase-like protein (cupin superfamily)